MQHFNHNVARVQRETQKVPHVSQKQSAVHRAVSYHRSGHGIMSQACNERSGLPMSPVHTSLKAAGSSLMRKGTHSGVPFFHITASFLLDENCSCCSAAKFLNTRKIFLHCES
jgi:hypothetical protein